MYIYIYIYIHIYIYICIYVSHAACPRQFSRATLFSKVVLLEVVCIPCLLGQGYRYTTNYYSIV